MRFVQKIAVLALLFIALFTWALVRSFTDPSGYGKRTKAILSNLTSADNRLLKDVLLARAALLQTYDPLVVDMGELRNWSDQLPAEPWHADTDAIKKAVQTTEDALERFKSDNALLQNSLAYFDIVATTTANSNEDAAFKNEVAGLASSVMHLLRNPTEADANILASRLNRLKQQPLASYPDAGFLYRHGMLLVSAIPSTNASIRTLQDQTMLPPVERIVAEIDRHRASIEQKRSIGNTALYVSSFLIFILLIRTLVLSHRDSAALHWTIVRERLAFEASRLFIACPPELIDERIGDMMKILVEGYRSDRGYVLRLRGSKRVSLWSAPNAPSTTDWPRPLYAFVPEILALPMEALRLPYDNVRVSEPLRQSLAGAGIKVWACVKVRLEDEVVALLCFDRARDLPFSLRRSHDNLYLLSNVLSSTFQRQRLYRKRAELEVKLRKAERLEAIGTFTSGVAHNFNNLIGAIAGQAEMAIDTLPPKHGAVTHVRQVLQTSTRAKEVAKQILDFGRIGEGLTQSVVVAPIIEETVAYIKSTSDEKIELKVCDRDIDAATCADPVKLQQVFHNVIINAIQASARTIEITVGRLFSNERELPRGHLQAGDYVRVQIKDKGQGIDAQTLDKIFEPFFTTRPTGTGLGLATAWETVSELEGGIEIESEVGAGTTVTVWLPETKESVPSVPAVELVGRTVMVVNGDRDSVLRDEELLATLGFEPVGFTDASRALEAIRGSSDRFDVLIVDKQISGMSMQAFIDAARGSFAGGQRIISTGPCTGVDPIDFEKLAVLAHVGRPWSARSLASTINGALANPGWHPANVSAQPAKELLRTAPCPTRHG